MLPVFLRRYFQCCCVGDDQAGFREVMRDGTCIHWVVTRGKFEGNIGQVCHIINNELSNTVYQVKDTNLGQYIHLRAQPSLTTVAIDQDLLGVNYTTAHCL